jgi:hypothetical protein
MAAAIAAAPVDGKTRGVISPERPLFAAALRRSPRRPARAGARLVARRLLSDAYA